MTSTAAFLIPVLAAVLLLYRGLAALQISPARLEALFVIGATLTVAAVMGLAAAFGRDEVRVLVFSLTTVLLLDMTGSPSRLFEALAPASRLVTERDSRRVDDLHQLQASLEAYIRDVGPLPEPASYGEGAGSATFWRGWWDVSSADSDGDGLPFLDFLAERGIRVPVDPVNAAIDPDARSGRQYVYALMPPGYTYRGGACSSWSAKWVYLLAITNLESETGRPPRHNAGSGCECLWRDAPNFFAEHFDYVLCGSFQ